ncbi:MAG TPA: hypothetical protein VK962_00015 [Actinomycetota bacterium]|nr:hypothetical protein [Actinomycetota bacterium]
MLAPALAQISPNPTVTPTLNTGGWVYGSAWLWFILGVLIALAIVLTYLRYAPRFQREEGATRSVPAARSQRGREAPRRAVKITGTPVTVPAPVAASAIVAAAPEASSAPAAVAAPASATTSAPAATPVAEPEPATSPAESAPAPAAPAATPAASTATAAPREHTDVSLDQETFDRVLAELLEKGTSRRVAEGQARRAAMIAARKKAEG